MPATRGPPTAIPQSTSATGPPAVNPRKRGRTACTRCKNRKQKCDDQWPTCSNCRKAGTECDKTAVTEDEPPAAYTRALQERVAFLELKLAEAEGLQVNGAARSASKHLDAKPDQDALGEVVEVLSSGNFEAPSYIGSSSGLTLALNLGEMVQATIWNKALPCRPDANTGSPQEGGLSSPGARSGISNGMRAVTMEEVIASSAQPPSDETGAVFLNAYFHQLHLRYPFLDQDEVWRLHANRMAVAATPLAHLTRQQRFGLFKLNMVYAIGDMLVQLTEGHKGSSTPEGYYMAALQHISAARDSRSLQTIEAMTLLVIYHLRSASSGGIWYMIGLAMRTCIDLGLHRKSYEGAIDPFSVQIRRRLFWSVYSLETNIAISLGRPGSIAARQIDVEFPGDSEERHPLEETPPFSGRTAEPQSHSLALAVFLFKIRRIESRIQYSIYRVDKRLAVLRTKVDKLYQELEEWRQAVTERFPGAELDYPMLHYYRAVRLLLQPFLALLPPTDPYYLICMGAAGNICQTHKKLHQSLDYGHSFIAVQTVFVSGMTLLYGLWTQLHAIWSVALANDIRACSLVLFVMGERAPWVRKYRDAFELLVNATMEKLQNRDGALFETAAAHAQSNSPAVWTHGTGGEENIATEDGDAWRVVAELAEWINQDEADTPVWMPDFEMLQNLPHS